MLAAVMILFPGCKDEEDSITIIPAVCRPVCGNAVCGSDGCGGTCGTCETNEQCSRGKCIENTTGNPQCDGRECGSDGNGGSCGSCGNNATCDEGVGLCRPWRVSGKLLYQQQTIDVLDDNAGIPVFGEIKSVPAADLPIAVYDISGFDKIGEGVVQQDGSFNIQTSRMPERQSLIPCGRGT